MCKFVSWQTRVFACEGLLEHRPDFRSCTERYQSSSRVVWHLPEDGSARRAGARRWRCCPRRVRASFPPRIRQKFLSEKIQFFHEKSGTSQEKYGEKIRGFLLTNCQVCYLQLSNYLSTLSPPVYTVFLRVYIIFLRDKVDFFPAQGKKSGNDEKIWY